MLAANNSAAKSAPVPAFPTSGGDLTLSPGSPRTWNSAEHAAAVTCLAWNERETTLTSGDASGLVVVWTAHAGGWRRATANQRRAGPQGLWLWHSYNRSITWHAFYCPMHHASWRSRRCLLGIIRPPTLGSALLRKHLLILFVSQRQDVAEGTRRSVMSTAPVQ